MEADRAEGRMPEQGKGVAGSKRPRYCRKCHVSHIHGQSLAAVLTHTLSQKAKLPEEVIQFCSSSSTQI